MRIFKIFEFIDLILLTLVLILIIMGVFFIYSSGVDAQNILVSNEYIKQIIWAALGFILMIFFAVLDFKKIKRVLNWMVIGFIAILVYTLFFGRYVNGARSWIGIGSLGIQPAEFAKTLYILFFAFYLEKTENTEPLKRFVISILILLVPMGLILLQPDLGTASVYVPIFILMCYVARLPKHYIFLFFSIGMLTVLFVVLPVWEHLIVGQKVLFVSLLTNKKLWLIVLAASSFITLISFLGLRIFKQRYFYWIAYSFAILTVALFAYYPASKVLKEYQIQRLIVFIDPTTDPRGSGWHIIQSKIAIGSGNVFGQGFLKGTQSHYRFLPQQSTDFIFSILSEELGFIGGIFVFALYLFIFIRIYYILKETNNTYGYYVAIGIVAMFFFHFVVNVGMVMGIMPITGIPLLFISYGGSSLWNAMICVGLLMSINARRLDFSA
ncbi:MAG TPA: rod shape-determining protein RodA [Treponemataceae bacterium]|nr:rod shape-determining protein RodA [Treponemataceae bacterium]